MIKYSNTLGGGGISGNGIKETYNVAAGESIKRGDFLNFVKGYNGGKNPVDIVPVNKIDANSASRDYYLLIKNRNMFLHIFQKKQDGSNYYSVYSEKYLINDDGTVTCHSTATLMSNASVFLFVICARIMNGKLAIFYERASDSDFSSLYIMASVYSFEDSLTHLSTTSLFPLSTWGRDFQNAAVCVYDNINALIVDTEWHASGYTLHYKKVTMDDKFKIIPVGTSTAIQDSNEFMSIDSDNITYNYTASTIMATYTRKYSSVWQIRCLNMLKTNPSSMTVGTLKTGDSGSFKMYALDYTNFLFVIGGTGQATVVSVGSNTTTPAPSNWLNLNVNFNRFCVINSGTFCALKRGSIAEDILQFYTVSPIDWSIIVKESFDVTNVGEESIYGYHIIFNIDYQYQKDGLIGMYYKDYSLDKSKAQFGFLRFINGEINRFKAEIQLAKALKRPFDGIALKSGNGAEAIPNVRDAIQIMTLPE